MGHPLEDRVVAHLESLGADYRAFPIDPTFADTGMFCERYGYTLEQSANAILIASKRPAGEFCLCLGLATTRLDVNRRVRGLMGVSKLSFATPEQTITGLGKIRNHFGVNRIAQAGALASLHDEDFVASVVLQVVQGRDEYYALAARLGLACVPSATNFVCIDVGGGDRARTLLARLQDDGVFVRMPGVAPLDRCVRVTVGTAEERRLFGEAFEAALALG